MATIDPASIHAPSLGMPTVRSLNRQLRPKPKSKMLSTYTRGSDFFMPRVILIRRYTLGVKHFVARSVSELRTSFTLRQILFLWNTHKRRFSATRRSSFPT